jgi:ABC-2 type transport system ATP-binding protein
MTDQDQIPTEQPAVTPPAPPAPPLFRDPPAKADGTPILNIAALYKEYKRGIPVLTNINLTIYPGRIIGLLGPNGSGKTTIIKLATGLLKPTAGSILVGGIVPGAETAALISYLPDKNYLNNWMKVTDLIDFFADFYKDFRPQTALDMLSDLHIDPTQRLKTLSKGTKEKVQLILVMSRQAKLYILDEPIAGVDPAARDYILRTILSNYNKEASVIISTHLIADIETILDEVIFVHEKQIRLHKTVSEIYAEENKTVDALFREVYRC